MKEKIKNFISHFLIIFVVFISVLSIINFITYPTKISLGDTEENLVKYIQYKKEAKTILENNACHNAIQDIIDYYETTSHDGEFELHSFRDEETPPLTLGSNLLKNCDDVYKDKFEEKNITGKILASTILYDTLYYRPYTFGYELNLKDIYGRINFEGDYISIEYNSERRLVLELISELLEIVKEEKENEE